MLHARVCLEMFLFLKILNERHHPTRMSGFWEVIWVVVFSFNWIFGCSKVGFEFAAILYRCSNTLFCMKLAKHKRFAKLSMESRLGRLNAQFYTAWNVANPVKVWLSWWIFSIRLDLLAEIFKKIWFSPANFCDYTNVSKDIYSIWLNFCH